MPWTTKNPPPPAKNWPEPAKGLCVKVANGVLRNGGSDKDAVLACISAVKKRYPSVIGNKRKASDVFSRYFDITNIELQENDGRFTSTLQFFPVAKLTHPWYGELDFNPAVLREMVRNFDRKVIGTDIFVDERHDRGRALGWIKTLKFGKHKINDVEYEGLFGTVDWTELGVELLNKKIYKYFSPEVGTFTDPVTQKEFSNVVFGGGLTNRPFLKMMPAVPFEEEDKDLWEFEEPEETSRPFNINLKLNLPKGDNMELQAFLNGLGFSTEQELRDFIKTARDNSTALQDLIKNMAAKLELDEVKDGSNLIEKVAKSFEDLKTENSNLKNQNSDLNNRVGQVEARLQDMEAEKAVNVLLEAGKVVPSDKDKYVKMYKKDKEMFEEITSTLKPVVEFGEKGLRKDPEPGEDKQFQDPQKVEEESQRYLKLAGRDN